MNTDGVSELTSINNSDQLNDITIPTHPSDVSLCHITSPTAGSSDTYFPISPPSNHARHLGFPENRALLKPISYIRIRMQIIFSESLWTQ